MAKNNEVELPPACAAAVEEFRPYVEGSLSMKQAKALEGHLAACAHCRAELEANRQLYVLMENTLGARQLASDFDARAEQALHTTPRNLNERQEAAMAANGDEAFLEPVGASSGGWMGSIGERLNSAPWWGVSIILHLLVVALAGLVSMSIELPKPDEALVTVTELSPARVIVKEEEKNKTEKRSALESKHETPPTDPSSKEESNIVVPPDILAKAEIGDHFETINLDREDTKSAFGNPDAHMFHSVKGNDDAAGGGGDGGSSMEDMIGVGAAGHKGTGGGWGGGDGTGTGVNTGSGHGSFGSRSGGGRKLMVKRHGGSPKTEGAVEKGLEWLARNQEADGSWNNAKHGGKHNGIIGDAAMTGFALLAFLGAGHTEKVGKHKEVVQRGIKWLIANQGKGHEGRWANFNYTNGIATMALGEAAGMARIPETKAAAQKAINGVDDAQIQFDGTSEREAWDYGARGKQNDSSVMAWNILALKSCKVANLSINHSCFEGTLRWINAGQDLKGLKPDDPLPESEWEGGMMSYRGTVAVPNVGRGSFAVTAAAALCRLMIGGAKPDEPGVAGPCNLILKRQIPKQYPFNLYFGYYATLLMFQKGGDHWKAWNEAVKPALCDSQVRGGADDGSWNPSAATGSDESRVMTTALAVLCLEVYYRYAKLNPDAQ
jgi:hypothetical protein